MRNDQFVTIRGEEELATRTGHLFAGVETEFICAATDMDTWSRPGVRPAFANRMRSAITDGVVARKLYTSAALVQEEQRLHLLDLAAKGAQVRICTAALPHETIIIDRRTMILAGRRLPGDREFAVTTSSTLIDGVHALLQATWDSAVTLADYLHQDAPHVDPDGKEILRVLGAGLTDEAAARRVGVSLRTYRRRVAELMALLEARSRFQAGVRAGGHGLVN